MGHFYTNRYYYSTNNDSYNRRKFWQGFTFGALTSTAAAFNAASYSVLASTYANRGINPSFVSSYRPAFSYTSFGYNPFRFGGLGYGLGYGYDCFTSYASPMALANMPGGMGYFLA